MVARRRVGLPAVLTLALAGVMVAAASPLAFVDSPDPAQLLADARRAVEDAGSFRFAVRTRLDIETGREEDRFASPRPLPIKGSWSDGRSYTLQAGDLGGDEAIVAGEAAYHRHLESPEDRADQVWTLTQADRSTYEGLAGELQRKALVLDNDDMAFVADQTAVEAAAWIYMGGTDASIATMAMTMGGYIGIEASIFGGFSGAPTGFLEAITELGHPDVVHDGTGVTTLVATLHAPDDLVDAFGHPIPDGTVELEVGPDDLPTALRVRIDQDTVRSLTEVAFTAWNKPVDIPVPSGDQVDTTPWLDEDGLRQLTRITFLAPTALPEGWGLMLSSTDDSGQFDPGYDECLGVQFDWFDRHGGSSDEQEYFSTLLTPVDCALDLDPTPFQPGGPGGFPSRPDPELPEEVEVLVGDMAVAVQSSFPSAEQDALIASLAPVDLEALITVASEPPPAE
jgi:hypothetical protein